MTDYSTLNKKYRQQKSALTRAVNSKNPDKVIKACTAAVREWNQPDWPGWPDDWSRWQRALDDALVGWGSIRLEDLA